MLLDRADLKRELGHACLDVRRHSAVTERCDDALQDTWGHGRLADGRVALVPEEGRITDSQLYDLKVV